METRIPIKKFVDDESLTWEERFRRLEQHHQEETGFLIFRITQLEGVCDTVGHLRPAPYVGTRFTCLVCNKLLDVDPESDCPVVPDPHRGEHRTRT